MSKEGGNSSSTNEFSPEIDEGRLPEGWSVMDKYPETVWLTGDEGTVIVQRADGEFMATANAKTTSPSGVEGVEQSISDMGTKQSNVDQVLDAAYEYCHRIKDGEFTLDTF